MLSITKLFILIIACSAIATKSVDAKTATMSRSSTSKNNKIQSPLLDRALQLFNDNNSVEEKMDGTCFGNQLDSGQQRSQGSYLWYVVLSLYLSNNIYYVPLYYSPLYFFAHSPLTIISPTLLATPTIHSSFARLPKSVTKHTIIKAIKLPIIQSINLA